MTEREQVRADIKRRLRGYRDLRNERHQLEEELMHLELQMDCPGSSNWDGVPRSPGISNPVERMAIKHLTLVAKYEAQLGRLIEAQEALEDLIEGLEPTERMLARYRYIDCLGWEDVCDKMAYSWRQTHRIHGRMIDKLVDAEMKKSNI